ncbi:hypothetical protein BH23CHL5_BH23CHL5_01130 [soil metagenome]
MSPLLRKLITITLLVSLSFSSIGSWPVAATVELESLPATPAGEQLAWAIDQINNGGTGLTPRRIEQRFTPEFLYWLPSEQIIGIFRSYVGPSGPMTIARFEGGVTESRANALLQSPSGVWRVRLSVEQAAPYRINDLYFEPTVTPSAEINGRSWSSLKNRFAKLAPRSAFIAAEVTSGECDPIARVSPDEELAIASSFKLYVLGELAHQVSSGLASWDESLALDPDLLSLPNGTMRYEPPGSLFPLDYFADQMMSQSDNTATDHLIARLGRENVEQAFSRLGHAQPELNTPLLMTREWFAIKMRFTDREIRRYELATEITRRSIIADQVAPVAATLTEWEPWYAFRSIETIEWFASASDLCRVLLDLKTIGEQPGMEPVLNALSLQPGITFDPAVWQYVGYKGGYETGVRSDVWLLQRQDGRWFVLAGIINNPSAEIDGFGMTNLMIEAAALLARTP